MQVSYVTYGQWGAAGTLGFEIGHAKLVPGFGKLNILNLNICI